MGQKFALVRVALFLVASIAGFGVAGFSSTALAQYLTYTYVGQPLTTASPTNSPSCPPTYSGIITASILARTSPTVEYWGVMSDGVHHNGITVDFFNTGSNNQVVNDQLEFEMIFNTPFNDISNYYNSGNDAVGGDYVDSFLSDGTQCVYSNNIAGTWTVVSGAIQPTAGNETYQTPANTPVTINFIPASTGVPVDAELVSEPSGGVVSIIPNTAAATFTPAAGFNGTTSFQYTLSNPGGTSNIATITVNVGAAPPPLVAVNETASTTSGSLVTLDLSAGATGTPTSATVSSNPAHGTINAVFGKQVSYTPDPCFTGTDTFQFTLADASGDVSNTATATITVTAPIPSTSLYLVSPFLLGQDLSNLDLTQLYSAQNWGTVQAKGLVADNTSAAIAILQTNTCAADVTFTSNNGTLVLPYAQNFLSTPPSKSGASTLTVKGADLVKSGNVLYAAALVQAPPAGAAYTLSSFSQPNPITVIAAQGSTSQQANMSLLVPPVILVHGIWGNSKALSYYANYLRTLSNYNVYGAGVSSWVTAINYTNDVAFDDPGLKSGLAVLSNAIAKWRTKTFNSLNLVGSRVDVVAHSMGGLVSRAVAGQNGYTTSLLDRGLGAIHQIITIDTPELGSNLANFLLNGKLPNKTLVLKGTNKDFGVDEVHYVWRAACGKRLETTVETCFAQMTPPMTITAGAVASLIPGSPSLKSPHVSPPAIPGAIWNAISAIVPQTRGNGENALQIELEDLIAAVYPTASTAPTIADILGDKGKDDAIVPLASQNPGGTSQAAEFKGLAHIPAPSAEALNSIHEFFHHGLTTDDKNVEQSADIEALIVCWLTNNGSAICNPK